MADIGSSSSSSGSNLVGPLRAAMRAGWWTLLIGALLIGVSWLMRWAVLAWELTWLERLWGASIVEIGRMWLGALVFSKLILFVGLLACIFLTILVRELSK
jgi:hypothetical protein